MNDQLIFGSRSGSSWLTGRCANKVILFRIPAQAPDYLRQFIVERNGPRHLMSGADLPCGYLLQLGERPSGQVPIRPSGQRKSPGGEHTCSESVCVGTIFLMARWCFSVWFALWAVVSPSVCCCTFAETTKSKSAGGEPGNQKRSCCCDDSQRRRSNPPETPRRHSCPCRNTSGQFCSTNERQSQYFASAESWEPFEPLLPDSSSTCSAAPSAVSPITVEGGGGVAVGGRDLLRWYHVLRC